MSVHLIVDLSNNNGSVDFNRLARVPGLKGVYLKTSEGATWADPDFQMFRKRALAAGLRVGAYHYARPDNNHPAEEAFHFAHVVGKVGTKDLRPALDMEQAPAHPDLTGWARLWNKGVKERLGVLPIFYSYPFFIQQMRPDKPIGAALWLASFGSNDGEQHQAFVPHPWKKIHLHQFTSNASVPGVQGRCDLSACSSLRPLLAHPVKGLL